MSENHFHQMSPPPFAFQKKNVRISILKMKWKDIIFLKKHLNNNKRTKEVLEGKESEIRDSSNQNEIDIKNTNKIMKRASKPRNKKTHNNKKKHQKTQNKNEILTQTSSPSLPVHLYQKLIKLNRQYTRHTRSCLVFLFLSFFFVWVVCVGSPSVTKMNDL